ncbi:MAG: dihydroorotase, partial [Nitrococcus sp.]|nr:dihydroorotase [Nitrococcus sp.]
MTRIRIHGGRVIDPESGYDRPAEVLIADGRILAVGEVPAEHAMDLEIDASGQIVCPGLIDLATRLGEPGAEHKATIASETRAGAAGGITTLVCLPDTNPVMDTPSVVELMHRRAQGAGSARVLPLGALTVGLAGERLSEMVALQQAGCAAMTDAGRTIRNTLVLQRALEYAATFAIPVLLTPADPWLSRSGYLHDGVVATRLGIPGIPESAEAAELGRSLALVADIRGRTHFGRLSSRSGVELIARAQASGLPVTADAAIHQFFLTETDCAGFDTRFHLQPPLRAIADRKALRAALIDETIGVICSDHQPQDADAKDGPFTSTEPGACGVDTLLSLLLRLVEEEVFSLR